MVEVGGGLRTYAAGGRELLDGYGEDELCRSGRGQVLLPWPNRLEDGSYEFDGERHQLPLDEPSTQRDPRPRPLGGVERGRARADRVVMAHTLHPRRATRSGSSSRIEYALSDAGLTVRTTATNAGSRACPFGCGAHPYLTLGTPAVDPLVLRVPARSMLRSDERGLPIGQEAVDGTERDFRAPRPIGATLLDHAYTDLERDEDGLARVVLEHPDDGSALTLWVDEAYRYLMVFTGDPLPDVNRRSLAVEPMTCPPNAFRTGEALIRLEPGDSFTGSWGLTPSIAS